MDKKRVVTIVLVVVFIIAIVGVVMIFRKKDLGKVDGGRINGNADEMGIHYGGSFDEFQYQEEEEKEDLEKESAEVDLDEVASETARIEKEFEKNKPGEVTTDDEELSGTGDRVSARAAVSGSGSKREEKESENIGKISDRSESGQNVPDESGEADDGGDIGHIIQSSGYAEHEVVCDAETQEMAETIAAQIGGTVLSYQNGIATIQIEENVDTLLERLEQEGSSLELHRNYFISEP